MGKAEICFKVRSHKVTIKATKQNTVIDSLIIQPDSVLMSVLLNMKTSVKVKKGSFSVKNNNSSKSVGCSNYASYSKIVVSRYAE